MITKPSDHLDSDRRFRHWGKLISSPADIDLAQTNGYSLGGTWIKWEESVSLIPGTFLVCASETGSAKYHSYHYTMIDGATGTAIDKDAMIALLDQALADGRITEEQRAKGKNSMLYDYALYITLQIRQ